MAEGIIIINKPVYSMSSVGECPRVLGAERMGHSPEPQTPADLRRLNHYTRLEAVAAAQISDLGYNLEDGGLCEICKERYGRERHGIHVETESALFTLVGHLDRIAYYNGIGYPVEIKSLGLTSWTKFRNSQLKAFPGYAGQECVYLNSQNKPGIYWIMDRDTGDSLQYTVSHNNKVLSIPGFTPIENPISFSEIETKLNDIEISVQSGELPLGTESGGCWFCRFKFLCVKEDNTAVDSVSSKDLVEAANDYRYAMELEKISEDLKSAAKDTLLLHSKQNNLSKYIIPGLVSVSYRGQRTKTSINVEALKKASPEIYNLVVRESSPFDDYTIRMLKEK